jgi:mannose-1-phosphate guanylyltransferase
VVDRSIVDLIPPGRMFSIEREVFPRLVGQGLYGHALEGYWMDVGTPERYLAASWDILERRVETEIGARVNGAGLLVADGVSLDGSARVHPPALIAAEASIGPGAAIGERAVIGPASAIGGQATVSGSVVLDGCRIGSGAAVRESILAPGVDIGDGARVGAGSVIGERARIEAGAEIGAGARIDPGGTAS